MQILNWNQWQNRGGPAAVIGSQGNIPLGNWEGCRDDDLKPEYSP